MCGQSSIFFDVVITDENLRGVKTSSIQTVKKETGNSVEIKSVNSRRSDNKNRDYKTQTIKNKERNYIYLDGGVLRTLALWLSNCTNIISGIYGLYFLNIYVFFMFPDMNKPQFRPYQV